MSWVRAHPFLSALGLLLTVGGVAAIVAGQNAQPDYTTTTVAAGSVQEVVSVSGVVEAIDVASLTFPRSGVISSVLVERGDVVAAGDVLATVGNEALVAERNRAQAAVAAAVAARNELTNGQTTEQSAVTDTTIANAEAALARTQALAREQVATALAALLGSDLEALAVDPDEDATAPTVSGTYTCTDTGTYTIEVFASKADSGYSYRLSGLESGTFTATTDQPAPLGECGLYLQFTAGDTYARSEWTIDVPNQRSSTYVTRQNAYTLALTQAEQNVQAARDTLALAKNQADVETAAPRIEALLQANAAVQQAQADVARINAQLSDATIIAPFAGTVTDVLVAPGEVARAQTAFTLLNTDTFELVARVPEIDITRLSVGQAVEAHFDANRQEPVAGTIRYVAPVANEIDGVGYFEAVITMDNAPTWMRAGLNADIDIVVANQVDVPRLPQRFIERTATSATLLLLENNRAVPTPTNLGLIGNDGFIEIIGVPVGTTVVAP